MEVNSCQSSWMMTRAAPQSPRLMTCRWTRCTHPLARPRRRASDALGATRRLDWHPPMFAGAEARSVLLTVMLRHMHALMTTRQRGATFCSVTTLWSRQPSCPRSSSSVTDGQEMDIDDYACSGGAGCVQPFSSPAMEAFFFLSLTQACNYFRSLMQAHGFPGWKNYLLAKEPLAYNLPPDSCTLADDLSTEDLSASEDVMIGGPVMQPLGLKWATVTMQLFFSFFLSFLWL